jgi:hypothetical protein
MLRRILFSAAIALGLFAGLTFTSSAEARPNARGGHYSYHHSRGPVYQGYYGPGWGGYGGYYGRHWMHRGYRR